MESKTQTGIMEQTRKKMILDLPHIQALIKAGNITIEQASNLSLNQCDALSDEKVRQQVIDQTLPLELVDIPYIHDYIKQGRVSFAEIQALDGFKRGRLYSPRIKMLIETETITIKQALNLKPAQLKLLNDKKICEQLMYGKLDEKLIESDARLAKGDSELRKHLNNLKARYKKKDFNIYTLYAKDVTIQLVSSISSFFFWIKSGSLGTCTK